MNDLDPAPIKVKLVVADVAPVQPMLMRGRNLGIKPGAAWNNAALFTASSLIVVYGILSRAH